MTRDISSSLVCSTAIPVVQLEEEQQQQLLLLKQPLLLLDRGNDAEEEDDGIVLFESSSPSDPLEDMEEPEFFAKLSELNHLIEFYKGQ